MNNDFQDIIKSLSELKSVTPDDSFRKHMEQLASSGKTPASAFASFAMVRFTLILLAILCLGTGSILDASASSKPGNFLYPVKQAVHNAEIHFHATVPQTKLNKPVPSPVLTPAITPLPTRTLQPSTDSSGQTNTSVEVSPTPEIQETITPTPTQHPAVPVSANIQVSNTPVKVNLSVGSNPASVNEDDNKGSKDDPNAEDSTSLLPQVTINTPLVHVGL